MTVLKPGCSRTWSFCLFGMFLQAVTLLILGHSNQTSFQLNRSEEMTKIKGTLSIRIISYQKQLHNTEWMNGRKSLAIKWKIMP